MIRVKGVTGPSSLAWKVNSSRISLAAVDPPLMCHTCRASSPKQRSLNLKNFPLTLLSLPPNLIIPPKKQSRATASELTRHSSHQSIYQHFISRSRRKFITTVRLYRYSLHLSYPNPIRRSRKENIPATRLTHHSLLPSTCPRLTRWPCKEVSMTTRLTRNLTPHLLLAPNGSRTSHILESANHLRSMRSTHLHQCPLQRLGGKALNMIGQKTPLRGSGLAPVEQEPVRREPAGGHHHHHHHRPSP